MKNDKIFSKFILTIIVLFYAIASIHADTTFVSQNLLQKTSSLNQVQTVVSQMTESEAYKLLYNNAKENSDRMISSIQWVIGISIAFLLAILGGQIFFNWRINKKEIDYIKKDIEEKIGELKAVLIQDISKTNKEQETALSLNLDKIEKELKLNISEQFDKKSKLSELTDKMREKDIDLIKKEFETEIKKLKIDITKNEGDIWKLNGVESNALTSYLETVFLKIELGKEIKYNLNDIISILEIREEIHQSDYNTLDKLVNKLTKEYNEQKVKIVSLYKDKPVYKWIDKSSAIGLRSLNRYSGLSTKEYVKNTPK